MSEQIIDGKVYRFQNVPVWMGDPAECPEGMTTYAQYAEQEAARAKGRRENDTIAALSRVLDDQRKEMERLRLNAERPMTRQFMGEEFAPWISVSREAERLSHAGLSGTAAIEECLSELVGLRRQLAESEASPR